MTNVLIYTKDNSEMAQILADQLEIIGYRTEQTTSINIPRLVLNPYNIIHFIISELPMSWNEILCLGAAKTLGKAVVVSLLNAPTKMGLSFNWTEPDGLTVSQTNYLKLFRQKTAKKMIIPKLFANETVKSTNTTSVEGFLVPLLTQLEESLDFKINSPVFFDGRNLLKRHSASQLRRRWTDLLSQEKIKSNYQLILSDEKIESLLHDQTLALGLAAPLLKHIEFTNWIKLAIQHRHLPVINHFQATGFSSHWTSGHNCLVLSSADWIDELNGKQDQLVFKNEIVQSNLQQASLDPIINDLSRLYTKILHQKTSLLDSDSAKI